MRQRFCCIDKEGLLDDPNRHICLLYPFGAALRFSAIPTPAVVWRANREGSVYFASPAQKGFASHDDRDRRYRLRDKDERIDRREDYRSVESVSLFYRDGGSDKVYHANLLPEGDGFVVHFAYGRRGSALVAGTKTVAPVPLEKAKGIFDKIVGEKVSKGYTREEGGRLFAGGADAGRVSGHVPQLLNDVTEAELAVLACR